MEKMRLVCSWICRIILASTFAYASYVKILHPDLFFMDIRNYQLLPDELSQISAYLLPAFELCLSITILIPRYSKTSATIMATLLFIFILAILSAWFRGLDISCGCFGNSDVTGNYISTILRDILLIVLAIIILLFEKRKSDTLHL